jgi:hypothetical protein
MNLHRSGKELWLRDSVPGVSAAFYPQRSSTHGGRIATAFEWAHANGTTPCVAIRVRLDPGAATTVRVIA